MVTPVSLASRPIRVSLVGCLTAGCLSVGLLACSSGTGPSSPAGPGPGATLTIGVLVPFTGADAIFGPGTIAGCIPAAMLINNSGGVLGHKLNCIPVDTRGDPADAVPATRQMLLTNPNLVAVEGPTSDEATPTIPILEHSQIPFFTSTGQAGLGHDTSPYFFRIAPPDADAGTAMALWGIQQGYKKAAAIFANDPGSQGNVVNLVKAFTSGGGSIVVNEALAPGQSSYSTEIARMLQAKPDVIFTELDPPTAATFFTQLKQLNGSLLPMIGADPTLLPDWYAAMSKAIGRADLTKYLTAENPASPTVQGPALATYKAALLASAATVPNPTQYNDDLAT